MAIVKVTLKNFTKFISEKIDNTSFEGMMASALLGGTKKLKESIAGMPDEQMLLVNTDHVAAVSGLIKIAETGDVVFRIFFKYTSSKEGAVWVKGEDYKRFVKAWAGEERVLVPGEYEVPEGHGAVVAEDGRTVKVVETEKD